MRIVITALLVVMIFWALAPLAALADITEPDTFEIQEARAWRHMLEPDDVLIIARYHIEWGNESAQPIQSIAQTFYFTYIGNGTLGNVTTLGNETAYPFYNLGYCKGLVAFYWEAGGNLTPQWGDLGNITVTAIGNASINDTLTLTSSDWVSSDSPATQREDLRQWLLAQLIFCELDWNTHAAEQGFTDRQYTLTTSIGGDYQLASITGQSYLALTIENVTSMVPLLFMGQLEPITYTDKDYELAQQTALEAIHGNDTVGETQEHLSNLLGGIGRIWASTILILIGCLAVIIVCTLWQRLNHGLLIAYVIILVATPEGLFQMGLMAIFPVIAVLYLTDIFLSKRST